MHEPKNIKIIFTDNIFDEGFIPPRNSKTYTSIESVWADLEKGIEIFWASKRYKLYISDANCEYQLNHFTSKNGRVLSARDVETYWGGLLAEKELKQLFSFSTQTSNKCSHNKKVINHAGGINFWQCADCKEDLGNL